jgi:hypothetical protein
MREIHTVHLPISANHDRPVDVKLDRTFYQDLNGPLVLRSHPVHPDDLPFVAPGEMGTQKLRGDVLCEGSQCSHAAIANKGIPTVGIDEDLKADRELKLAVPSAAVTPNHGIDLVNMIQALRSNLSHRTECRDRLLNCPERGNTRV